MRISTLFVVILTTLAAAGGAGAQTGLEIVLRTSGHFVSPPGSATPGFDAEMLDRFLAWYRVRQGRELAVTQRRVETVPDLLAAMQGGEAGLGLGGITITAERDRTVDFSQPYLPVRMVLIARRGQLSSAGWRDELRGKRLGAITGSTNAKELAALAASHPESVTDTTFPTNEALFAALGGPSPTLDGAVVDITHFWTLGKDGGLVLVDSLGTPQGLGFVLPEGSALKPVVDAFVQEFTGSSAYYNLVRKYFGGDAEEMVRMAKGK